MVRADRVEALVEFPAQRQPQGNTCNGDLAFRPCDARGHGGHRHQEQAGDLRRRCAHHQPQTRAPSATPAPTPGGSRAGSSAAVRRAGLRPNCSSRGPLTLQRAPPAAARADRPPHRLAGDRATPGGPWCTATPAGRSAPHRWASESLPERTPQPARPRPDRVDGCAPPATRALGPSAGGARPPVQPQPMSRTGRISIS
jgi:hypothetical protein